MKVENPLGKEFEVSGRKPAPRWVTVLTILIWLFNGILWSYTQYRKHEMAQLPPITPTLLKGIHPFSECFDRFGNLGVCEAYGDGDIPTTWVLMDSGRRKA
jgi:hypothetical protein